MTITIGTLAIVFLVSGLLGAAFVGAFLGGLYWDEHARVHLRLARAARQSPNTQFQCTRCGKHWNKLPQ